MERFRLLERDELPTRRSDGFDARRVVRLADGRRVVLRAVLLRAVARLAAGLRVVLRAVVFRVGLRVVLALRVVLRVVLLRVVLRAEVLRLGVEREAFLEFLRVLAP